MLRLHFTPDDMDISIPASYALARKSLLDERKDYIERCKLGVQSEKIKFYKYISIF